ncbi:hypothetical protein ACJRO7_015959 [Eucalyptus globulus]|uniref:PGG domain-containing protein n=1 Tax=Eucalyptus globulus TaxID=34317 RepID=A0ABD3L5H5_EUCGL
MHGKESSMDIQSSGSKFPPPPVDEEGSSGGMATDKTTLLVDILESTNQKETKVIPTAVVNKEYRPLFLAAMSGYWKHVEKNLAGDYNKIMAKVMTVQDEHYSVLDIAVMFARDEMVEELVKRLPKGSDVDILKKALMSAARTGRIRMVKALVNKIVPESEILEEALRLATSYAHKQKEVISYLADNISTPKYDTMISLIMAGHLVVTIKLKQFRKSLWNLATKSAPRIKSFEESHLRRRRSFDLAIVSLLLMERDMDTPKVHESLLKSGIVLDAAARGITEIVFLCLELYPELMWEKDFAKELIKEIVNGRHVDLFRLVNTFKTIPYLTDDTSTRQLMEALVEWQPGCVSMDVSGAAFLLQRELQWFKVLEDRSNPSLKSLQFKVLKDRSDPLSKSLNLEETNERRGKTFWEIFVEERQDLLKEAGQWMKDTSSSCSVVATLIITVTFTAAFTVPGGNDSSTGIPIFLKKGSFKVFVVANALALFSSVTATLMFLAILTSSYAIEDFRRSLPRRMILGLSFLFLSLAFMLVAFGSALAIVLSEQFKWIYPIIWLVGFPVALFAILQLPLYVRMVKSTYWPRLYHPMNM